MSQKRRAGRQDQNKPIGKKSLSTMSTHELSMLATNASVKSYDRIKEIKRIALYILMLLIVADLLLAAVIFLPS